MTQIVCLQVGGTGRCNCQCNCNNCTRGRLTVVPRGVVAGNALALYLISVPVSSNLCASVFLGNSSWATTRIITRSHSHSFVHSFIYSSFPNCQRRRIQNSRHFQRSRMRRSSFISLFTHVRWVHFFNCSISFNWCTLSCVLTGTHMHSQQLQMNRYFDCIERFIIC